MPTFNVFYEWQGSRITVPIGAGSPQEAAAKIRKQAPGAVILKVKVDKSGNRSGFIPFYKPGEAKKITEKGKSILADVVRATGLTVQEMTNTDSINGKSGTVIVDELPHWETVGDPRPRHR